MYNRREFTERWKTSVFGLWSWGIKKRLLVTRLQILSLPWQRGMSSSQMCCSIWRWNGSFWWHWSGQVFLPTCQPIQNKPTMLLFLGRKEKRRRWKWKNQIGVVLTGSLLYRGSQNFSRVYRNLTLSRASLAKSVILLSCSCHCFNKNFKNSSNRS